MLVVLVCIFGDIPVNAEPHFSNETYNTVTISPKDFTEDEIIQKAIIKVKVDKKESVYLMSPDEIYDYSYECGRSDDLGETLRAIVYLESRFGEGGRIGDHGVARGITQVQIPTAKFILKRLMGFEHTKFTTKEIKMLLTKNDRLCMIMSKIYLVYLMDQFQHKPSHWSHGLLSYNVGIGNVQKHGVVHDPNGYLDKARRFIQKTRGS